MGMGLSGNGPICEEVQVGTKPKWERAEAGAGPSGNTTLVHPVELQHELEQRGARRQLGRRRDGQPPVHALARDGRSPATARRAAWSAAHVGLGSRGEAWQA